MGDRFTPEKRRQIMSSVKGQDSGAEKLVRRMIHGLGFRFRLHRADLPGKPDVVLPRHRKIVFVHGCFWHGHSGCSRSKRPSTNLEFWNKKLDGNVRRDIRCQRSLRRMGWRVLVVWGCEIGRREALLNKLERFLND